MKICAICGKKPFIGSTVTHRGMLKKQGGVGRRTVRVNRRRFLPNLQTATIIIKGTVQRARVCTSCIRSGLVPKAPLKASRRQPQATPAA